MLADSPENISVATLRALEGSLAPTDCVSDDRYAGQCGNSERCVTGRLGKIRDGINNVIDNITLQELIDDYYRNNNTMMIDNT